MKKIKLTVLSFLALGTLSVFNANAQLTNGGFESYNTLPTCPTNPSTNTSITHCQTWNGLSSYFPSTCSYTDYSGSTSQVQYYNSAAGGTSGCVQISAYSGT
ncbi:MAG TPA: hypothetical protein VF411_13345, partial [Bacteroidia bacterium]